jgi:hypothetical protein
MELVKGETLAARLKNGLLIQTVLLYGSQIAAALVEAHGKGIIHRDLKPGNIIIAMSGVKVLDFGLAKSGTDETVTDSRMVMGTPAYMAPEQREGKPADARTDIYSFGCVLYEMLTGGRVTAHRMRIPSRRLEKIVNRCLEEDPARRWQSAVELERELAKVTASATPWKAVAASAGIIAVFAAAYAYLHRPPKLTEKETIVLSDFDNKTGDPVFDDTLRQGLAIELQQSPFLSLISDTRIRQTLALMGQRKEARLTAEVAREVCERTGSAAILEGSIARLGSQYVLGLRATGCTTGSILDQAGAGGPARGCPQHLEPDRSRVQNPGGRIVRHGREACNSSVRGYDPVARSPQGLHYRTRELFRLWREHTSYRRAVENRSAIRDGLGEFGPRLQFCWRVCVVGREYHKSLATAGSSERLGEVFYRLPLRTAGHGKSGKGVTNARVVASDLSSGRGPGPAQSPAVVSWPFHPWDRPV